MDRLLAGGSVADAKEKKEEFKGFSPAEWLVDEFTALKRSTSDGSFKKLWDEHCTSYGHRKFDVKFHYEPFVLDFVNSYKATHGITEVPGIPKKVPEDLLDQFKDMQRNDYNFKAAWEIHIGPEGKRDPRVHTEEELMKFMTDYSSNALPGKISGKDAAPIPGPSEGSIVGQLKLMQRNDSWAKELWGRYCMEHSESGLSDPAMLPDAFVKRFVDAYNSGNLKVLRIDLSDSGSTDYSGYGKAMGKGKGKGYGKATDYTGYGGWWGPY
eukprot:gnl/TRDRNA2_/TRDRNA2_174320_c2_seq5.p1 gnl/TRDRNA2_/TRDRNA2_174320_c2~~gnl/TRDRNA2_/TRDRNA2_174320_c2_seq5.p1  ORF type:complete len:287 (+),score=56.81 gnl/TRDRNA2_/TRDRNA2_174320_c2_seq5:59-862(+)